MALWIIPAPCCRLANLAPEDLYVLLRNIRHVYAGGDPAAYLLPDEAFSAFMEHCSQRVGSEYFRTPRTTITAFIDLLATLEQNQQVGWRDLIAQTPVTPDVNPDTLIPLFQEAVTHSILPELTPATANADDELATFRL